ncbi:MAG: hypothetical protein J3R72DRAFT_436818 [Linnemannia gamsii]|nr:MAG: hypothetical protein J3R72DRAFT_436818 [Linnemannia gamsii]
MTMFNCNSVVAPVIIMRPSHLAHPLTPSLFCLHCSFLFSLSIHLFSSFLLFCSLLSLSTPLSFSLLLCRSVLFFFRLPLPAPPPRPSPVQPFFRVSGIHVHTYCTKHTKKIIFFLSLVVVLRFSSACHVDTQATTGNEKERPTKGHKHNACLRALFFSLFF